MFDAYDNFDGGGSDDSTNQAVANAKQTKETNWVTRQYQLTTESPGEEQLNK